MNDLALFLKGIPAGMKEFGTTISGIVNAVLLCIVYLAGVGITAMIARLCGKRFIDMRPSKSAKSYWTDLGLKKKPEDDYYRQF